MSRDQLRHGVVRDARELLRGPALRDFFERGVGQRDDLPVVAERIHLGETHLEIEQLLHPAQPRADVLQLRRNA